jgi:hypothetical protein
MTSSWMRILIDPGSMNDTDMSQGWSSMRGASVMALSANLEAE